MHINLYQTYPYIRFSAELLCQCRTPGHLIPLSHFHVALYAVQPSNRTPFCDLDSSGLSSKRVLGCLVILVMIKDTDEKKS